MLAVEITVAFVAGLAVGFAVGIFSCCTWRPHHPSKDETVALKITEGKDEY